MLTVQYRVTRYSNICTQYDLLCTVCFKIVSHSDLGQTLSESPTPNRLFISGWCQRAPGWYRGWASGKCCIQRWVFVWRPFVAFSALSHLHYCRLGMPSSPDYNDSSYYSLAFFFFFFFFKWLWLKRLRCNVFLFFFLALIVYVMSVMAVLL